MQTVKFQSALTNSDLAREETGDTPDQHLMDADAQKPLPLRYLLTRPVVVSVANYATLALLGMVSWALMPLIWSTSIEFGGLDMSPASIGVWLSVFGCMNGIFQLAVFPRAVTRFGPRSIFVTAIGVFAVVYTMFPFENLVMRRGADNGAWPVILVQLTGLSISEMGYSESICRFVWAHAKHLIALIFAQVPYSCISVPPPPTGDHSARQTVSHNPWPQCSAQSGQPSRIGSSHSRSRITSWVGTLSMSYSLFWSALGCMLRCSSRGRCGNVMSVGYH